MKTTLINTEIKIFLLLFQANEHLDQHRLGDVDDQESVILAPHPGLKLPARKPYMNTGKNENNRCFYLLLKLIKSLYFLPTYLVIYLKYF